MAVTNNFISRGLSGKLGKDIVFKRYKHKTIITKYPDMENIIPSEKLKVGINKFRDAVTYAKAINDGPIRKAVYSKKIAKGKTVFNYAIAEYLKNESED